MVDPSFDYQFRLIVVGDSTVGKSSLLRNFCDGEFCQDAEPTVGVDFYAQMMQIRPEVRVKLQLWDTAGQERFRAITRSYYRNSAGVLLLYDITNRKTFEHLDDWFNEAKKQIDPYQAVFLLVGTKMDLKEDRQVTIEEARNFAEFHDMGMIETSSKTGTQVKEAFQMIAKELYELAEAGKIQTCDGWEGMKRGNCPPRGSRGYKGTDISASEDGPTSSMRSHCCNIL